MSTATSTQQEVRLKSRPQGMPTEADFEIVECPVPDPPHGHILVKNAWISVDPYMRGRMRDTKSYVEPFRVGEPLEGGCIGQVVESLNPDFQEGTWVLSQQTWSEYWVSDGQQVLKIQNHDIPIQAWLSVLGLTGFTAWVGLNHIGNLQPGENVFVSAASGAVGSVACQIAKLKNCHVVGSTGSDEKVAWLQNSAGVDAAFNYHSADDLKATLQQHCPQGIDVYFDNVGGDHLEAALENMNEHGRVICCGMISSYNDAEPQPGPNNLFRIITNQLRLQGFIVRDYMQHQDQFQREMQQWIQEGKIVWEETVTHGLHKAPVAFINLFHGDKLGKSLVKV